MFLATLAIAMTTPSPQAMAHERVDRAIRLLGGKEKLASIRQLATTFSGHEYLVEQSERPTGPFLVSYSRGNRTFDFDKFGESGEVTTAGLVYGEREFKRPIALEKGVGRSAPFEGFRSLQRVALGPERALLFAAQAADLTMGEPTIFNGVPHEVVAFSWGRIPVRLFLKRDSGAPSGIETTSPLPFPWTPWGDVPMTTRWGNWRVLEKGVMLPSQFTTEANGYPIADETVISAKLTFGPGSALFTTPAPLPPEDAKGLLARYKPVKVADGITQYQGPFNTFVVEQPDGLVVIEPVMSPAFATAFLDLLAKERPGKRVKAVVASDDAWPHFGGIRTFVARGAELVVLDVNRPIVQRICDASHRSVPDELALRPAKARMRLVRGATTMGAGPNRMVLYPIAGQGSERMLMAYFPGHRLLYGSDLLQKQGAGFFFPAYPKELVEAVNRERLDVATVFAEHLGPTDWSVVTSFVASVTSG